MTQRLSGADPYAPPVALRCAVYGPVRVWRGPPPTNGTCASAWRVATVPSWPAAAAPDPATPAPRQGPARTAPAADAARYHFQPRRPRLRRRPGPASLRRPFPASLAGPSGNFRRRCRTGRSARRPSSGSAEEGFRGGSCAESPAEGLRGRSCAAQRRRTRRPFAVRARGRRFRVARALQNFSAASANWGFCAGRSCPPALPRFPDRRSPAGRSRPPSPWSPDRRSPAARRCSWAPGVGRRPPGSVPRFA